MSTDIVTNPSPASIDALSRTEDLSLRGIRQAIPRHCFRRDRLRSWWTLFRILGCLAACLLALSTLRISGGMTLAWQLPLLMMVWLIYGWVLVGLFVVGHDCGHGSFSKHRWVNDVVGALCLVPLGNSPETWKLTHNHHHAHTLLRGEEVDWSANLVTRDEFARLGWGRAFLTRLGYAVPFGVFIWILCNTVRRGFMLHTILSPERLGRARGRLLRSNLITAAGLLVIYGGLWYFFGVWGMLKTYGIPATVALFTGSWIITVQHADEKSLLYEESGWNPVRGQMASTFDTGFPRWLEYLWCSINIHVPHHIAPSIPWYHLKEAGEAIRRSFPSYYLERSFRFRHISWFRRTPFLKRVEGKGYYLIEATPH